MKTETWNGCVIRFIEKAGEWWAVAKDVCDALGYADTVNAVKEHCKGVAKYHPLETAGGKQKMRVINEKDIYRLIFRSKLPEAEAFQDWVYDIIKELRKSLGLSEYEAFRLMDKGQQKAAMRKLMEGLHEPVKVDYIKANAIADKAVSNRYGLPKMIKKGAMTEAMLRSRQSVLDDVAALMTLNERFNLGLSISAEVYRKYGTREAAE
jgi:prophage antirepressor-like protein